MTPDAQTPGAVATPTGPAAQRTGVWAPRAGTVELLLGGHGDGTFAGAERRTLERDPTRDGWWDAGDLPEGADYGFSLDGGPGRPDPRSRHQPYGVHGPSRVVDLTFAGDGFAWTDAPDGPHPWAGRDVRGEVLYELHVGTFTPEGTLDAAITRLPHLAALGVGLVELMPLAAFDGRWGWGYDGVDLYAVHDPYGGPGALARFVDAAHAAGLGVVLDVVYNHLGPSGNYLAEFGPYFTDGHHTPWGAAVNLDGDGSGEVRRWIVDNAVQWLRDYHVDALRLDAVHALVDDSPRHLLAELSDTVAELARRVGRPLSLIAESDENQPLTVRPTDQGGRGMTAQWADDVHHAVHAWLTGERQGYYVDFGSVEVLRKALTHVFVHDGTYSTYRGKVWGAPLPEGSDGHQFVVFDQDHDQVGNRATGDRPSARLSPGALAASAALIVPSAFTPMLFMGEEWGARTPWQYFTDHADPALGDAVRKGRRREFAGTVDAAGEDVEVPDPQDHATRDRSVLDWSEPQHPEHARLLDWYRTLVALRADPAVASGRFQRTEVTGVTGSADEGAVVVHRPGLAVAVARDDGERTLALPADEAGPWRLVAAWDAATTLAVADGAAQVTLPGAGAAVLVAGPAGGRP